MLAGRVYAIYILNIQSIDYILIRCSHYHEMSIQLPSLKQTMTTFHEKCSRFEIQNLSPKPAHSILLFIQFEYYIVYSFLRVCKQSWHCRSSKSVARDESIKEKRKVMGNAEKMYYKYRWHCNLRNIKYHVEHAFLSDFFSSFLCYAQWNGNKIVFIFLGAFYAELKSFNWREDFWLLSIFLLILGQLYLIIEFEHIFYEGRQISSSSLDST